MANPDHLKKLQEGVKVWNQWRKNNSGVVLDFSGATLSHVDLRGGNLSGMNLCRARLYLADFRGADLIDTDLSGADLTTVNLCEANLSGADLHGAQLNWVDFSGADLSWVNLSGAILEVKLTGADLRKANLGGAEFYESDLSGADLSGANLRDAILAKANLKGANLAGADLRGADIHEADLRQADLTHADLRGGNLGSVNLRGAILNEAILVGTDLRNADFSGVDLSGLELNRVNLRKANLNGANLSNAGLHETDLSGANLRKSNLSGADLNSVRLWEADFSGANLCGAYLRNVNLDGAKFVMTNLEGVTMGRNFLSNLNLNSAIGLDSVAHLAPSSLGVDTIKLSEGKLSVEFLQGCGLAPWEIEIARLYNTDLTPLEIDEILATRIFQKRTEGPLLIGGIFISYDREDSAFVEKLYKALQDAGVSAWLDRHDMLAGDINKQVVRQIRLHDVVVLVLSERSIESDWVEMELEEARNKERTEKRDVICPIAIDDSWESLEGPLWRKLKRDKNILGFSDWKTGQFAGQFEKLIKGLQLNYT